MKAKNFNLPASNGTNVSLEEFTGKNVVLYFYPKDNTPGCSKEACSFRDFHTEFENSDTVILGISKDSLKKHNNFIEKFDLPFLLLSDEDGKVCELYGVWKLKKNYGREYMGIERSTFIIGKKGEVVKEWRKVKVAGHVEEVLDYIKNNLD